MRRRMAKSNGHVSVLLESTTTGESEYTSDETSDTESVLEDRYYLNESLIGDDDVVPTYILQPREISKNIDLMRTVAILLEGKLKQPQAKVPDIEKIRELYSDIHRFPEAFQKFTSIVHQIQYLNVTPDWENSAELQNSDLAQAEDDYGSLITKVLSTAFSKTGSNTSLDYRRKVMLNLLNNVQKVFGRYQIIQNMLEERLKKYQKSIVKKLNHDRNRNADEMTSSGGTSLDTIEDDNHETPLLTSSSRRNSQSRRRRSCDSFLQKFEVMAEILRKTHRNATDAQDSIDVLRDLIRWDYKQATTSSTSLSSPLLGSDQYYGATSSRHSSIRNPSQINQSNCSNKDHNDDDLETSSLLHSGNARRMRDDVEAQQNDCLLQGTPINNCINTREKKNRTLLIFLAVLISLVLIFSIITVALSFLKFSY